MGRVYRIGEFSERIGRSVSTVRRWESEGRVTARRASTGQRYFDDTDVRRVSRPGFNDADRRTVVYCRVSSPGQKDDLASQVASMEGFCLARGLAVDEWTSEVGGGMNPRREKFLAVMDAIENGDIAVLVVAHKDRLARFGFDDIAHVATRNGGQLIAANQESLSPRRELVEDPLTIVHTFSRRPSGLRRYDKTPRDELIGGTR